MGKQADKNNDKNSTLITLENMATAAQRLRPPAKKRRHKITVGNLAAETNSNGAYPSDGNYAVSS
jgi:hypothetical protein